MCTTNGIITEVVECHECSNHRRSEMKYSSINKRLFVSVGWKGELVFRHCYFCKETNRRHIERQFFFIVIQIFRVASLSTLASNDIADSSVSLLSLLSSAVVSYQRVFLQLFFSHETKGIIIKYIFPTSAWFLYLGEKAYFRWVKRLRGKGKKNGLMENFFAEYWGQRHGKNDRIEKSLCIATLRDRKWFVCLFVFFKIVVKIKIRTIHVRKILIQGKL